MAKDTPSDMAKQVEELGGEDVLSQKTQIHRRDGLSTGSTQLNLAMTDNPFIGFIRGHYYLLVGDSSSGKTFLSLSCFAEAASTKAFKDYRLIYDNAEDGMLMDVDRLFGKAVSRRLEPPRKAKDGTALYSYTVEDFYYHLDDAVEAGKPFIYVMDSMDALTSTQEVDKFGKHKKVARGTGKKEDAAGSFGAEKAKINSTGLRKLMGKLRESGSILIILCQTRDNLGFGFEKKVRSGGHALKFYATVEIWSAVTGKITKIIKKKARPIGVHVGLKLKKNRITGKTPEVEVDIYPSYGIDDIGGNIDYLLDEGWWEMKKQSIVAGEFDTTCTRAKLIAMIEKEGCAKELQAIVGQCWREIVELSAVDRPSRY